MIEKYISYWQTHTLSASMLWLPLIPISFSYISKSHLTNNILKILVRFLIYDFINSIICDTIYITRIVYSNLFFVNSYNLIEFLFFAAISYQLNHSKIQRKAILVMCFICLGLFVYEFSLTEYGSILGTIQKAFLIILVFFYFNTLLSTLEVENIYQHPPFWIHAGLMVYASLSILNELATSPLIDAKGTVYNFFWKTMQIATILFHLILAYSFWISGKETKAAINHE